MKIFITIALFLVINQINGQGGEGGEGGEGGDYGGYEGGYDEEKLFGKGKEMGVEKGIEKGLEEGLKEGKEKGIEKGIEKGVEKGFEKGIEKGIEKSYGGGYGGYGGFEEKKIIVPGAFKPYKIPYFKPIYSYNKFPNYGYGGYGGKLIPLDKLPYKQPHFDLTQFLKPYEYGHLLKKKIVPETIVKYAKPITIVQPPITKVIYQPVYVKQPHIVEKRPVIRKSTSVIVKKKPAQVEFEKEVPVDINDHSKTVVQKIPVLQKPVYEKSKGGFGEEGEGGIV